MRGLLSIVEAARPESVAELLELLAARPRARLIAGGTDVMVRLEAGQQGDESYLDVTGLAPELRYVRLSQSHLEIGALATFWDVRRAGSVVAEFPLLEASARTIGAVQIQSRGTWAGNVANASPAGDGVGALLACDAELVLESAKAGRRIRPLHGFYSGYKKMDLKPGEFIREIRLPRIAPDRYHAFHKVGTRRAQAITKAGLVLNHRADGTWRVVGISLAPYVTRYPAIEDLLNVQSPAAPLTREALRQAVDAEVKPIDDLRSTSSYRRRVFRQLLESELVTRGLLSPNSV
jgi:CO/xanthine dehydrogenase FAD-binding subunit